MPALYDPSTDPSDMRAAVRAFPEHLAEGWARGAAFDDADLDPAVYDGVVLCGMGGSAIGGDLVRGIVEPTSPLPFVVNRGYTLPAWVGEGTLVIASSYSGGTEETLAAFGDAIGRGADVVVVTSGGEIVERAAAEDLDVVTIPGGLQPRAALGYSLGVGLRLARALGLAALPDDEVEAAFAAARERAVANDEDADGTLARDLAGDLSDAIPLIYTGVGLLEPVGMRWRTQIHENAKHPAYGNLLPELNHNEIMGFEAAPEDLLRRMHVVALRDVDDHPQVAKRFDSTCELVSPLVGGWTTVESEGGSRLARALSLIQLGDAVSFWMSVHKGVDPTPVETIQALKKTLA